MAGASVRELCEEGGDGRPHIGARLRGGRGRVGGDGVLPGLGGSESVEQGLYAIWVLEEEVRDSSRGWSELTSMLRCGISCALRPERDGWGLVTPLIA